MNKKITAEPPTYGEMWFMDTDFCERCDGLLDDFGICSECGWESQEWDEEEYDDPWWDEED